MAHFKFFITLCLNTLEVVVDLKSLYSFCHSPYINAINIKKALGNYLPRAFIYDRKTYKLIAINFYSIQSLRRGFTYHMQCFDVNELFDTKAAMFTTKA